MHAYNNTIIIVLKYMLLLFMYTWQGQISI